MIKTAENSKQRVGLSGLSSEQVKLSYIKYGANILKKPDSLKIPKLLLKILFSPILILLSVSAAFTILLGQVKEGLVIFGMVILSAVLDFFQEYRSDKAAEILSKKLVRNCTVLRDNKEQNIEIDKVVPGDLVFISTGDILPADGILESHNDSLLIDESVLTGESLPVEKTTGSPVFAGTIAQSGWGWITIQSTGSNTEFGKIAEHNSTNNSNAFEIGTTEFSWLIFKAAISIVTVVLFINLLKIGLDRQFYSTKIFDIVLFSVSIAVGLAPELLPVIMSINKSRGAMLMNKKGVLVKKLDAIPDFGSMDILCTDKTGTLTENKIDLVKHLDSDGNESDLVLFQGYLNSHFQTGLKNPLDAAILAKSPEQKMETFEKIDEIPYDFNRRRLSVIVQNIDTKELSLNTKGQFEEILKICQFVSTKDKSLDEEYKSKLQQIYDNLSAEGYRVLAIATREANKTEEFDIESENNMIFKGFLAFFDPPKKSATEAVKILEKYNVKIKIITGDNELVTQKVCSELNIPVTGTISGDELDKMDVLQFSSAVENYNIFARCNPNQKQKIIKTLRNNGHIVGYLGDGINDAPSLKESDIGISVNNAVDVARESADIILLNNDLKILLDGIIEGRRTFDNTVKYMLMAISSNFGNMLSMVGAAIFLPFLPMQPVQILLNNSLYDLSQIAIPTDHVDKENLESPQKWNINFIRKFMLIFGSISTLFDFATFYMLFSIFKLPEQTFQTAWFLESISTQVLVIYIIRTKKIPFIESFPSKWLVLNTVIIFSLAWLVPFTAFGTDFNFQAPSIAITSFILITVFVYLVTINLAKNIFYKRMLGST